MSNIINHDILEQITQEFTTTTENLWNKYSKSVNITKHFKVWWNEEYNRKLTTYQASRRRID